VLLTITTTHQPATDLGFLLHKNPARVHEFKLTFGTAHVFYPEASETRCTAALLLDVDPVALVRGRGRSGDGLLTQYVNDRPYAASSFLSVAISRVFGTALGGRSKDRPELVLQELPLAVRLTPLPCRGGEAVLRSLFGPLGYQVTAEGHPLDRNYPDWGESRYFTVSLETVQSLSNLLAHLYVLVPVLDSEKHYWVGDEEVEKLLRRGEGWLAAHPEKETIARRYLKFQKRLAREALARLADDDEPDPETARARHGEAEQVLEKPLRLNDRRMAAVVEALQASGAKQVIDLGCGEGRLLRELLRHKQFEAILGVDASVRALELAANRLRLERLAPRQRARISLLHGAFTYRDKRLEGYDAAAAVEVIEHLDLARLAAFERALFEFARPGVVIVTTPNREYNAKFDNLPAGKLRHRDHRFEWTRAEFQDWANRAAGAHGYQVEIQGIGEEDPDLGTPTQMGIFERCA
jgi:3' terminal RNA ribose 2'-O-methyltransferase Hen1